jgi:hypothetical protein
MARGGRSVLALVAAGVVLAVMAWFDSTIMHEARQRAAATFDPGGVQVLGSLGTIAEAGAVLLLALLAWRSRSRAVGAAYIVVGLFFAILPWFVWTFAAQSNDTPPVLPDPLPGVLGDLYQATSGPLNAIGTIGAGMAIAGVAVIRGGLRGRSVTPGPATASTPNGRPAAS